MGEVFADRIFTAVKHDEFPDTMHTVWLTAAENAAREKEANPDAAAITTLYKKFARNTLCNRPALKFQLFLRMLSLPSCWFWGLQQDADGVFWGFQLSLAPS